MQTNQLFSSLPQIKVYARICAVDNSVISYNKTILKVEQELTEPQFFVFDKIFSEFDTNSKVFNETIEDLVIKLMQGQTSIYFAYGSTSQNEAIHELAITTLIHVFDMLEERSEVYVEYYQMYCNKIRDLFNPDKTSLDIRENNVY